MKKGLTKHWIEIIGGVIIVVLILLAILIFGTSVSTAVEDAQARAAFREFTNSMKDASSDGVSSITDFNIETSVEGRYYTISYIPQTLVRCWLGSDEGICQNQPMLLERGENHLEKCYPEDQQRTGEFNDICMCVLRIDPAINDKHDYHLYRYNLFGFEVEGDYLDDASSVNQEWNQLLFPVFEARGFKTGWAGLKVEEAKLKVLDCSMVIRDIGCSYYYEGTMDKRHGSFPCILNYEGSNLYWITGGRHPTSWWNVFSSGNMPMQQESITLQRDSSEPHKINLILGEVEDDTYTKFLESDNLGDWPLRGRVVSTLMFLTSTDKTHPSEDIYLSAGFPISVELTQRASSSTKYIYEINSDWNYICTTRRKTATRSGRPCFFSFDESGIYDNILLTGSLRTSPNIIVY